MYALLAPAADGYDQRAVLVLPLLGLEEAFADLYQLDTGGLLQKRLTVPWACEARRGDDGGGMKM